jgi:uncharacterized pyridoxal phosphate-dependent enzyme
VKQQNRGVWQELGLPEIINAAGKMTYLGSSVVSNNVAAAMVNGAQSYVEIAELRSAASRKVAKLTHSPHAHVVASGSAGIVQAVAASITGTNLALIEQVPFVEASRRKILLQKSHAINYGVSVTQLIKLGGGMPTEVGSANRCTLEQLENAIDPDTAAILFVVSHHVCNETEVSLPEVMLMAKKMQVPVILDAAAESDIRKYVSVGVNIAIFSGHKAVGGPTSGLILGEKKLVEACIAQERGVGRTMKVGKEAFAGILVALENFMSGEGVVSTEELLSRLHVISGAIDAQVPISANIVWDKTRPIPRLVLTVLGSSKLSAVEIVQALEINRPSIRTRNHEVLQGRIGIDPRELLNEGAVIIAEALNRILRDEK